MSNRTIVAGYECHGQAMTVASTNSGPGGHITYNLSCGYCYRRALYDPAYRPTPPETRARWSAFGLDWMGWPVS